MSTVIWVYVICRHWRGFVWTMAWMFAFWMPALIPGFGWLAPPLLAVCAVMIIGRRDLRRPINATSRRAHAHARAHARAGAR